METVEESVFSTARRSLPLLFGLGAAQVLTAVALVVGARVLGPGPYGRALSVMGVASFAATLVDFGGATYATRHLARPDTDTIPYIQALQARLFLAVVGLGLALSAWLVAPSEAGLFALVPLIAVTLALEQFTIAPLRARSLNGRVAAAMTIDKLVGAGLVVALATYHALSPSRLLLAIWVGMAAGTTVGWLLSRRNVLGRSTVGWRFRPSWNHPWSGSGHLGLGGVATGAQFLDVQFIRFFAGASQAGQYAAVARWSAPLGLVSTALSQSLLPVLAVMPTNAAAWARTRGALRILAVPALGLLALAVLAGPIVRLLLGAAYADSITVIRILAVALIAALVNQPLSAMLQARHEERVSAIILVVGVVMQLVLIAALAALFGAPGAAMAFGLAQLGMLVAFAGAIRRLVRQHEGPR